MAIKGEVLDNQSMTNHTNDFKFNHGPSFGAPARIAASIFAFFFTIMFVVATSNGAIVGMLTALLFLIPILFVISAHTGVIISKHSNYFKEYSTFMGIKYGKWKSARALTDVAILTIRKTKRVSSTFGAGAIDIEDKETGVYFLIPSHRKRVLINVCKNKKDADKSGQELAEALDKKFTIFNPQVSEASKARRYR